MIRIDFQRFRIELGLKRFLDSFLKDFGLARNFSDSFELIFSPKLSQGVF